MVFMAPNFGRLVQKWEISTLWGKVGDGCASTTPPCFDAPVMLQLQYIENFICLTISFFTSKASSQQRARWLNLVPGGGLQSNCNKEGFNSVVSAGTIVKVRIGILGNEQNDCYSPDTVIGIGIGGSYISSLGIRTGSTLNKVAGKGYIFIR